MDRNPVLQDLHTFHNPPNPTGTNYQGKVTDNMFPTSNNNSTISNASDTQSTTSFLDTLDFTSFDSSRFYQPPVPEPQQQQQNVQQQQQHQNIQQQQQQQHHHHQQQHQQHQQQQQQHQNPQSVYPANVYYQPQQLHHLQQQQQQQQQYLPVYATPQQHNQILLQRYNSNGSTTSSTNSQPSYMSNYSPMAHYNQSMQQQEQAANKMYYNEYQQQIQVPPTLTGTSTTTKKRKPDVLVDETVQQKKKPKAKKKKVPKIIDPNAPPKPKRKTGLNKPLILSEALSELMDGDKELSRPELVQKLWKYIKGNDLQDPADRRFILCDAKLKKIFDQDRINSFGMNKDLSAHLTKKEEPPVTIETNETVTKDIVQQEPTPSEDNNTTDFLL